jgi:membrane protease YdiL (CAAX protease family)
MRTHIPARPLALFLVLSFGGAWLVASPLWLNGQGLATPGSIVFLVAMMFIPALAARVTEWVLPSGTPFLKLTTLKPARPFRRWIGYAVIAWLAPIIMTAASLLIASLLGVYQFDLVNFSGAAKTLSQLPGGSALPVPIETLVGIQLVSLLFAPALNVIPALGEEIGWRGYLQQRLLPLGQWPAVLLTGVAWGLWHAPVILLGYNYPGYPPALALTLMVIFCTLLSVLLGWLTIASGTVWTAAIAHGFINGVASLGMLVAAAGPIDTAAAGLLGYSGWAVMMLLIILLVALRRFPRPSRTA